MTLFSLKGNSVTSDPWSRLAFLSIVSLYNDKNLILGGMREAGSGGDVTEGKLTRASLKGDVIIAFYCMDLCQSGA